MGNANTREPVAVKMGDHRSGLSIEPEQTHQAA